MQEDTLAFVEHFYPRRNLHPRYDEGNRPARAFGQTCKINCCGVTFSVRTPQVLVQFVSNDICPSNFTQSANCQLYLFHWLKRDEITSLWRLILTFIHDEAHQSHAVFDFARADQQ